MIPSRTLRDAAIVIRSKEQTGMLLLCNWLDWSQKSSEKPVFIVAERKHDRSKASGTLFAEDRFDGPERSVSGPKYFLLSLFLSQTGG
jgi:hypothetical protein